MSSYIDLDSTVRDFETYPNPAEYRLSPDKLIGWSSFSRRVRSIAPNPSTQPLNFATSVSLLNIIVPFDEDFVTIPRLYVDFRTSSTLGSSNLISQIDGRNPDAIFVCVFERIQNNSISDPIWIHYRCLNNEQVMHIKKNHEVNFRVFTSDGNTLPIVDTDPPDPFKQVYATFSLKPYVIDGDYDNQNEQVI